MLTQENWTNNQNLLYAAREKVLALGKAPLSYRLFQFRLNPSDPSFPLSYRRLDRTTLKALAQDLD